jgi:hypothetical protein
MAAPVGIGTFGSLPADYAFIDVVFNSAALLVNSIFKWAFSMRIVLLGPKRNE